MFIFFWFGDYVGVLGVVAAGLYRARWAHLGISALARLNIRTFWRAVVFVVNCLVFVLIGHQLRHIAESLLRPEALSWVRVVGLIVILSAVTIGVRFLWIFTATYGVRWLMPSVRRRDPASARVSTLISWCGMRGVVSLAAVLALPPVLPSGEPFPQRDLVILLTFGIVFVTLVGQGLTLPALIRALRFESDTSAETEAELAREAMRRAAILAVDELVAEHGVPAYEAVTVTRFFNGPLRQRSGGLIAPDNETRLWLGAAAAQREALLKLWREEKIGDDVLSLLEREIDLAEARLVRDD